MRWTLFQCCCICLKIKNPRRDFQESNALVIELRIANIRRCGRIRTFNHRYPFCVAVCVFFLVSGVRFELTTYSTQNYRATRLHYPEFWSRGWESNPRPLPYQGRALPLCYHGVVASEENRTLGVCVLPYEGSVVAAEPRWISIKSFSQYLGRSSIIPTSPVCGDLRTIIFDSGTSHLLGVRFEKIQKFTFESPGNFERISISSLFVMFLLENYGASTPIRTGKS